MRQAAGGSDGSLLDCGHLTPPIDFNQQPSRPVIVDHWCCLSMKGFEARPDSLGVVVITLLERAAAQVSIASYNRPTIPLTVVR